MKKLLLSSITCLLFFAAIAQKKALKHSDYDSWKNLSRQKISNNGKWVSYEINPQKGDSYLYIYNSETNKLDSVQRGYSARFTSNSKQLIFKIKAQYDTIRQAKLDKIKKEKMPKDSLGIWNLTNNTIKKVAKLKSLKTAKEKGQWISYLVENDKIQKDSTKKAKKNKFKTGKLNILNINSKEEYTFSMISEYIISEDASSILFIRKTKDSLLTSTINIFDTKTKKNKQIDSIFGEAKNLCLSSDGSKAAFLISTDTCKNKTYRLKYFTKGKYKTIVDIDNKNLEKDYTVSEYGEIFFSNNSDKLFFGARQKPINEKKDSLLEEEKYHLDVWNWKDPLLQPQQKLEAEKELKRTFLCVFDTKTEKIKQLSHKNIPNIELFDKANSAIALGKSSNKYKQLESWDTWYNDYYTVDINTGEKELILEKKNSRVSISPSQKYVYWYETKDSTWNSYNIKTKSRKNITQSIQYNLYNETHDMPCDPRAYGIMGWTKDDKYVLVYDQYDIWKVDPEANHKAINITKQYGRQNNIVLRYIKLDKDKLYIDLKKDILLKAFNKKNKKSGYFKLKNKTLTKIILDDYAYTTPIKSKKADKLIWKKSDFKLYPNLHISNLDFSKKEKISEANPQQKDKLWGSVELVKWTTGDGEDLQGLLYKPDNFDPNKKYPMLVYFYERTSDRLHKHYVPQPNWSIINPSYCASNGYIIFMPDISYKKVGYPGESAYSSIVTGTLAMADRYKFIDKKNIALQGQSWGGYQIAYLITRTNLYKCAMSGAPVSNMTSAYGGIRWKSGRSRMFQYEHTQSRIGGTLWNSTLQYIENSPIFFAPKIETPLLIMHNDNDGAVPWYQGIELFVAMRRLQKPCWMLTYNKEQHNLMRRANRQDLSIRTMQFFDHYLKGKPAPAWMEKGIPATKKGKYDAYELIK